MKESCRFGATGWGKSILVNFQHVGIILPAVIRGEGDSIAIENGKCRIA